MIKRLFRNLIFYEVITNLLAAIGIMWGVLEVTDYFFGDPFSDKIKPYWWLFLSIGLIYTVIKCWPKNNYCFHIPNRDSKLEIELKNIFKLDGSIIVTINNHFDVNPGGNVLNSSSMLAQFVKEFYDNKPDTLQHEINAELAKPHYNNFRTTAPEYKIGTVVPVKAKGKQFYILANTTLNQQNRSTATKDGLEVALNELWTYLSDHCGKEDFIIPIIGTGRGRIPMKREDVFKEIILSFLASCSADKNYANKLIICIDPKDIKEHKIAIEHLVKWSEAKVSFADFQKRTFSTGTNVLN
jgi:hypothetical protein